MNPSAFSARAPVNRARALAVVFGLLSTGCSFGDTLQPYYSGSPPEVSGLSNRVEEGNIGGGTVLISGSGFGSDTRGVTVIFGSQNATVVAASDSEIEVVVPRGPIEGGFVDVVVGTESGQIRVEDGYQYDTTLGTGTDIFENQVAYIAVTDDYFSCGGGIGQVLANPDLLTAYGWRPELVSVIRDEGYIPWEHGGDFNGNGVADDYELFSPYETFCNEGLTFGGYVGIEGRSEMLEFAYPRIHSLFAGYRNGFGGNFDVSPNEWSVQVPSQDAVSVDIENFYDDLRHEIDDFVITNVDVLEAQDADERAYCADLSALVDVEYVPEENHTRSEDSECLVNGTRVNAPFYMELEDCSGSAAREYDLAEMKFCQFDDYENTRSFRYEAEWPVGEYFFRGTDPAGDGEALSYVVPTTIQIDVQEAGINGVQIELPEAAVFQAASGFNTDFFDPSIEQEMRGIYGLLGFKDTCADSDDDGQTGGDEVAASIQWRPSDVELTSGGSITGARTFVRFTITAAGFGWYGGEGAVMKATITVPDAHNVDVGDEEDPSDDLSTLEIPASILYQVPSILQNFGGINEGEGDLTDECGDYIEGADISFEWAKSDVTNYGFVITQAERVTEYAINAPALSAPGVEQGQGDLVFAYSSGDIGYTVFGSASDESPSWLNPVDSDSSCSDCADSDGDGWTDSEDPDCTAPDVDGDGVPDVDAASLQEDNSRFGVYTCNDGIDNDDDGDIDGEDSNCATAFENEGNCDDGIDNDRDGWTDDTDPDCGVGGSGTEVGFSDLPCNDDIDNDGDGAIDTREPECVTAADRETTCSNGRDDDGDGLTDEDDPECADDFDLIEDVFNSSDTSCNDGIDNDGDGWIDLIDPDCPYTTFEEVGFTDFGCNNGIDDDGQGDVDAFDPTCQRLGPEGDEFPAFTAGCDDGSDNDGDGYTDGNDPDCEYAPFSIERNQFFDPAVVADVPACYNGIDDDLNGDVDSADPDCVNAFAEPSGHITAEDPSRPECTNGVDDDGDGWVDSLDPDCASGDTEDGFTGAGECNDGVDNDGDSLVDTEDPDCADASSAESD